MNHSESVGSMDIQLYIPFVWPVCFNILFFVRHRFLKVCLFVQLFCLFGWTFPKNSIFQCAVTIHACLLYSNVLYNVYSHSTSTFKAFPLYKGPPISAAFCALSWKYKCCITAPRCDPRCNDRGTASVDELNCQCVCQDGYTGQDCSSNRHTFSSPFSTIIPDGAYVRASLVVSRSLITQKARVLFSIWVQCETPISGVTLCDSVILLKYCKDGIKLNSLTLTYWPWLSLFFIRFDTIHSLPKHQFSLFRSFFSFLTLF